MSLQESREHGDFFECLWRGSRICLGMVNKWDGLEVCVPFVLLQFASYDKIGHILNLVTLFEP